MSPLAPDGGRGAGGEGGEPPLITMPAGDSDLTQAGKTLGTPAFMSPEQAAGKLDRLGPASDIYSLGATLYCLLTGKPPFAETDVALVLGKVERGDVSPPRQLNKQVPAALEAICLKAMALYPVDRYRSAKDLAGDLEHWLADEAIGAYCEPWQARLGRWSRRHRTLVTGAAAAVLVAVASLAVATVFLTAANEAERAARRDAQENEKRAMEQEKTAKAEEAKAQERLVYMHVATGVRLMDEGDLAGSLPWFAKALEEEKGGPEREEIHRMRLAAVWQQCPRLVQLWLREGVVEFSSDNRRLITRDGSQARVWDTESGQPAPAPLKHNDRVWHVAFSPDGRRVVTVSGVEARVWDAQSGQPVTGPLKHNRQITHAAISPDGRRVVTASDDETASP